MQQRARIADIHHGRNARAKPAVTGYFRPGKAVAQLMQGFAAKHCAQKQAARLQGAADLHQTARQIIDPMQAKIAQHQIKCFRRKWQRLLIRNQPQALRILRHCGRNIGLHNLPDPDAGMAGQQIAQFAAMTAKIKRPFKFALLILYAFQQARARFPQQKIMARQITRRPLPALAQQIAVKGGIACGFRLHHAPYYYGLTGTAAISNRNTLPLMPDWIQKLTPYGVMLADALLPPRCLATGDLVDRQGQLSARAWRELNFITNPLCQRCGLPFAFGFEEDAELACGACIASPPDYDRARAVFQYDDASRAMILAFKHGDRMEGAPAFAVWMARAGAELMADADLVVPVPLHRWRLLRRRYNQSAVLALSLARLGGLPVRVDALMRTRHTPPMGGLNREARLRNLRGAIAVRPGRAADLSGRKIILIDDVLTTGATAQACARVLRRAGAARVDILTLARVVRPG